MHPLQKAYQDYVGFIRSLSESVKGLKLSDQVSVSPVQYALYPILLKIAFKFEYILSTECTQVASTARHIKQMDRVNLANIVKSCISDSDQLYYFAIVRHHPFSSLSVLETRPSVIGWERSKRFAEVSYLVLIIGSIVLPVCCIQSKECCKTNRRANVRRR